MDHAVRGLLGHVRPQLQQCVLCFGVHHAEQRTRLERATFDELRLPLRESTEGAARSAPAAGAAVHGVILGRARLLIIRQGLGSISARLGSQSASHVLGGDHLRRDATHNILVPNCAVKVGELGLDMHLSLACLVRAREPSVGRADIARALRLAPAAVLGILGGSTVYVAAASLGPSALGEVLLEDQDARV